MKLYTSIKCWLGFHRWTDYLWNYMNVCEDCGTLRRPIEQKIGVMNFKTKPVVKEAFRYNIDPRPDWFTDKVSDMTILTTESFCKIKTLEGEMQGDKGDWIIQGLNGEIYPCKPDIFEKTYEPAE